MIFMPMAHASMRVPAATGLKVYALPDGTIPIICSGSRTDPSGKTEKLPKICDACRLTAAPGLASTPAAFAGQPLFAAVIIAYWPDQRPAPPRDSFYHAQSRAPPTTPLA